MTPLVAISSELSARVDALAFPSVPYLYARSSTRGRRTRQYLERWGASTPREVVMVGINPGPFGMAQTGVPFGDVAMVRDFLGVTGPSGSRRESTRCDPSPASVHAVGSERHTVLGLGSRSVRQGRAVLRAGCSSRTGARSCSWRRPGGTGPGQASGERARRALLGVRRGARAGRGGAPSAARGRRGPLRGASRSARAGFGRAGRLHHPSEPREPGGESRLGRHRRPSASRRRLRAAAAKDARIGRAVRRPTSVELMLLATVLLWALNLSVTKYILDEGLLPLSYATIRYGLAGAIFVVLTLVVERSLRIERRHLLVIAFATVTLWLNQVCFVLALDKTTASTIGLILGAIPIFAALFGLALGRERLSRRFWLGRPSRSWGSGSSRSGPAARCPAATSGSLSGSASAPRGRRTPLPSAPLMQTYSPSRVAPWSSLGVGPARARRAPADERPGLESRLQVWPLLVFATIGPLVLTNVFWFRSISRIGPARATLAANLQPFVAAVLAVILLSEPLGLLQVARRPPDRRRDRARPTPAVARAGGVRSAHGRTRLHAARRLGPPRALGRQRQAVRLLLRARVRFTRTAYAGPRPASATARRTCSSRATSASCSRAASARDSEICELRAQARRRRARRRAARPRRGERVPAGGPARRSR